MRDPRWTALEKPARWLVESGLLERLQSGPAIVDESRVRTRTKKPTTMGEYQKIC